MRIFQNAMILRTHLFYFILLILSILTISNQSIEAKCALPLSPVEQLKVSEIVFIGKVSSIEPIKNPHQIKLGIKRDGKFLSVSAEGDTFDFSISESFKGIEQNEVKVNSYNIGSESYYPFKKGEKYLVYAGRDSVTGEFVASGCTRTQRFENADFDIASLRLHLQNKSETMIFGEVNRTGYGFNGFAKGVISPISKVNIEIIGNGQVHKVLADKKGNFQIKNLPIGKYKVRPQMPVHFGEIEWREIEVREREVTPVYFGLEIPNKVSGKVFNHKGQPVSNGSISMVLLNDNGEAINPVKDIWGDTDEKGYYELTGIPKGKYLLGHNISFAPEKDEPFPPTFYKSIENPLKPGILEIDDLTKFTNFDLHLPKPLKTIQVRGVVVYSDGKPVKDAIVNLIDLEFENTTQYFADKVETDAKGGFSAVGFVGRRYRILVIDREEGLQKSVEFTLDEKPFFTKLILSSTD